MIQLRLNLPESFFHEEIRDGYMVSSQIKKVWAIELDLLNEFMRVCRKYNIRWFADGGTILGAARHKGFIPWDDDIDIMMFRDDYNKLITISADEFQHPYYLQSGAETCHCHLQLRNSETTAILKKQKSEKRNYNQGIFIDIFPIDSKVEDRDLFERQCKKLEALQKKARHMRRVREDNPLYLSNRSFFYKYAATLRHLLAKTVLKKKYNYEKIIDEFDEVASLYNHIKTKYVCKLIFQPFQQRRIWDITWFEDTKYLPFETIQIPVPSGYIELLDKFYGNWHNYILGRSTHGDVFFDVEKTYKEYINGYQRF